MAEDAVELLYSPDDSEVIHGLKLMCSLALDEPDNVVAAGGVETICGLLSRTGGGSETILQEAAVALYLLLEDQDSEAQAAFVRAHGRSCVRALLARPGVSEEALSWSQQILDILPPPTAEEIAAEAVRDPQPERMDDGELQREKEGPRERMKSTGPAPLPEYRVMCRAVARREVALDSKRGVILAKGTIVRPVTRCSDPSGVVTRLQLGVFAARCVGLGRCLPVFRPMYAPCIADCNTNCLCCPPVEI